MSNLLFWQGKKGAAPSGRTWIHQPDLLVKGHIAYQVKFLGSTTVDQPKGIEVVKDAIKKLNFSQQLKNKENSKCKKVEITISVDGVAIQEPRTSNILHQFPLHRISYCADDKGAKKYFSFIAKGQPDSNGLSNGSDEEHHECFVFVSTKLAAEITLTIGQAFDLAYRRFLKDNGKYMEMQKLQLNNKKLELQVTAYRTRLLDLARLCYKDDLQNYLLSHGLSDVGEFRTPAEITAQLAAIDSNTSDLGPDLTSSINSGDANSTHESSNLLLDTSSNFSHDIMVNPSKNPVVGTKLEGLMLNNSDSDSDFNPREEDPPACRVTRNAAPRNVTPDAPAPLLAPPPKASKRQNGPQPKQNGSADLFGSTPFSVPAQPIFNPPFNGQINSHNGQNPMPSQIIPNGQINAPANNSQNGQNSQVFPISQQNSQVFQNGTSPFGSSGPNYEILRDFNVTNSVFNTSNTFTNGLAGVDPFETRANGLFNGNGYGPFGGLSEKQTVALDSNFSGFLDKTISEMKDGFSRGIAFGNDDFNVDHLDPLKKN